MAEIRVKNKVYDYFNRSLEMDPSIDKNSIYDYARSRSPSYLNLRTSHHRWINLPGPHLVAILLFSKQFL